jgi:prepilin-type N-terminal cleavage/methylation domain-containing protein
VPLTRADQARAGFTLVELIVGLMLALIIAGVAYHLILASGWVGRSSIVSPPRTISGLGS